MTNETLFNTTGMTSAREMAALHRARAIKKAALQKRPPQMRGSLGMKDGEFSLPDEPRYWNVMLGKCPQCGFNHSHEMHRTEKNGKSQYAVFCGGAESFGCTNHTEWFPSSQQAIQHWQVLSAMLNNL